MIFPRDSAGVRPSGAENGSARSKKGTSRPTRTSADADLRRNRVEVRTRPIMNSENLPLPRNLLPLVGDFRDLRFGCFGGVPRTAFALDDAHEHPRDDEAVANLHRRRVCESRMAEIHGPTRRILERLVLPGRIGLRIVREPRDQAG